MCAIRWLSGGSPDTECPQKRESGQKTEQEIEYWNTCPLSATDTQGEREARSPLWGPVFPCVKGVCWLGCLPFCTTPLVLGFGGGLGPEQAQGLQGERPFTDTALQRGSGPHRVLLVTTWS